MRPISNEKRELIIAAKERGETEKEIALWLGVSMGSVGTLWRRYRAKGDVSATKYSGRQSRLSKGDVERVISEVESSPDITINELIEKLSLPVKKSQLSRLLIRLGYTVKKRRSIQKTSSERMSSRSGKPGARR